VRAGRHAFATADAADIRRLTRTLVGARVFADESDLMATWEAAPWRIQATARGDVAVLSRWRDHLDLLAIDALWCREPAIADAVRQIRGIALEHGFADVLGPPTPVGQLGPYEAAGMHAFETATTYVLRGLRANGVVVRALDGVSLREATPDDIRAVLEVDYACFDEFWRYDARHIERFLATQRLALATSGEAPIGYTLSTVSHGDGVLGRVAVVPAWRGRGLGRSLVADALAGLRARGADRASLCTQVDNAAARALYAACGFEDTGQHFAFARFGGASGGRG
jgi:ribosomal-protein-alanine N-acetyltransferase